MLGKTDKGMSPVYKGKACLGNARQAFPLSECKNKFLYRMSRVSKPIRSRRHEVHYSYCLSDNLPLHLLHRI